MTDGMSASRQLVSSGSPLEPRIGFSRAVRAEAGQIVAVAGTAPIGADGATIGVGDAAAQMERCLEIAAGALREAGAELAQVVRTRVLLVDRADWAAVADVHGRWFGDVRPACTVMIVSGFIDPQWLVEIEVDAVIPARTSGDR